MTKHNFLQIKQEACPSTLYSDTNEGQRDGTRVKNIFVEGNNETVRMGATTTCKGYGQRPQTKFNNAINADEICNANNTANTAINETIHRGMSQNTIVENYTNRLCIECI